MAEKQYNIGSQGPFKYDDAAFPAALDTTGTIRADTAPAGGSDMIRLDDVGGGGPVAPADASYVVISLSGDLSVERVLAVNTTNLSLVDGGAGGNITLDTVQNIDVTATPTFQGMTLSAIPAGVDNSVLVSVAGVLSIDEIDSRVWGSSLVDYSGTPAVNQVAYFADVDTIQGSANFTFVDNQTLRLPSMPSGTDNSVVIFDTNGRLKHDEIDPKVWAINLVDYIGTPADGQLATWASDGTIRGESGLTYDGSNLVVTGDIDPTGNINLDNGNAIGIGAALERLEFYTAGYAAFMGCSVGIGTVSPGELLHVSGGDILLDNAQQIRIKDAGGTENNVLILTSAAHTDELILGAGSGIDNLSLATGGIRRLFIDPTGKVGIGTNTIPHGGVGYAKFAIEGTAGNAAGPHIQFTVPVDNYPLMQILNWNHDDISIAFDSYYDAAWKSSDAGSSFLITKLTNKLRINYGVAAAGGVVTWNEGIVLDNTGNVGIGTVNPSRPGLNIYVATNAFLHLTNSTTGDTISDGGYLQQNGIDFYLLNQESGGDLFLGTDNSVDFAIMTGGVIDFVATSRVAGDPATDGYFVIKISGVDYKVPCLAV